MKTTKWSTWKYEKGQATPQAIMDAIQSAPGCEKLTVRVYFNGEIRELVLGIDVGGDGPHSRACGTVHHHHGAECAVDCPTCHGGLSGGQSI